MLHIKPQFKHKLYKPIKKYLNSLSANLKPATTSMSLTEKYKNGTSSIPTYSSASNRTTINSKTNGVSTSGTQIPMYQQKFNNNFKKDDQKYQQIQQTQQHQQQKHVRQQILIQSKSIEDPSPSILMPHLPDTISSFYSNHHLQVTDKGVSGGNSGSSSGASSSPLSPPNYSYLDQKDNTTIVSEMNKLYRKSSSPFLQRKFSNGSKGKYNDESPKKESMFSNFGQTILRNLTTSPFSQKKNVGNSKQQTFSDATLYSGVPENYKSPTSAATNYDNWDGPPLQNIVNSPAFGRKRFQPLESKLEEQNQLQGKTSLIPVNYKNDSAPPAKVQGNHSPIVLQRFYHQQNQLREKELERQKLQQQEKQQYSPEVITTNPFLSSYIPPSSTTNHNLQPQYQNQNQHSIDVGHHLYQTNLPASSISAISSSSSAVSSHSTSSQSSTQSSNSQIGAPSYNGERSQISHEKTSPSAAKVGIFGTNIGNLQYQPLPQQYINTGVKIRKSRSPPISPDSENLDLSLGSKLDKFYNQVGHVTSVNKDNTLDHKEFGTNSDQGWFNTLTGAMKRQISSYVKFHLNNPTANSTTTPTSPTTLLNNKDNIIALTNFSSGMMNKENPSSPSPTSGYGSASGSVSGSTISPTTFNHFVTNAEKLKKNNYYRTISATDTITTTSSGGSNTTSSNTSPTTDNFCSSSSTTSLTATTKNSFTNEFHEGNTSSFLRRYAVTSGANGTNSGNAGGVGSSQTTSAHILANLDRRHRSPDPPPRYNRGQSPLLLRRNLLELTGQQTTNTVSPLLNRRYVTASPPLPPPRRGSESVPGSPQNFRSRIHYTPEPQRRVYRTIDQ